MDVLVRCQLNNTILLHGRGNDTWTAKINIGDDILMGEIIFSFNKEK